MARENPIPRSVWDFSFLFQDRHYRRFYGALVDALTDICYGWLIGLLQLVGYP